MIEIVQSIYETVGVAILVVISLVVVYYLAIVAVKLLEIVVVIAISVGILYWIQCRDLDTIYLKIISIYELILSKL